MIKGLGNGAGVYQSNSPGKNSQTKASDKPQEEKATRLEQLKAAIDNGEYKVDLDKLAHKMAEALS